MKTLIDKAINMCGSVNELAKRLEVQPNVISMHRNGRPLSPETASELANVTGDDACEAAIIAMVYRAKGTRREEILLSIFKSKFSNLSIDKVYA